MENMIISTELIEKLRDLINEFETATDDDSNEDYLSDGEWLDRFYDMACLLSSRAYRA